MADELEKIGTRTLSDREKAQLSAEVAREIEVIKPDLVKAPIDVNSAQFDAKTPEAIADLVGKLRNIAHDRVKAGLGPDRATAGENTEDPVAVAVDFTDSADFHVSYWEKDDIGAVKKNQWPIYDIKGYDPKHPPASNKWPKGDPRPEIRAVAPPGSNGLIEPPVIVPKRPS